MAFKDYFSLQAADYAQYRPYYPAVLYEALAQIAPARDLAWDCAAGNGQVAVGLAKHFAKVVATDASASQIESAIPRPNIEYRVEPAETTRIPGGSVDLITVGQALHWLDLERFYGEVRRVAKPGGVIAVWCYGGSGCGPGIDEVSRRYYQDIVGPYWPPERKLIEQGYQTVPFPFGQIAPPVLAMEAQWDMRELLGYLGTWSATQLYIKSRGSDPRELIIDDLQRAWGSPEAKRRIQWPLHLKIGRI